MESNASLSAGQRESHSFYIPYTHRGSMWVFHAKINPPKQTQLADLWSHKAADRLLRSSSTIKRASCRFFLTLFCTNPKRWADGHHFHLVFFIATVQKNRVPKASPGFYQAVTFNTLYLLIKRGTSPESLRQPFCSLHLLPADIDHTHAPPKAHHRVPNKASECKKRKKALFKK